MHCFNAVALNILIACSIFAGSGSTVGMTSLLEALAFNPTDVAPAKLSFEEWERYVKSKKKAKSEKEEKKEKELPRRLPLDAFSSQVGWRPTGPNPGQIKSFVERFPTEFRTAAMGKVILPEKDGLPYVCPDGSLPCSFLPDA